MTRTALLASAALVLARCTAGPTGVGECPTACASDEACFDGTCRKACNSAVDCDAGEECSSGVCVPSGCGNGRVEGNEECDAGMANADSGPCTSYCNNAVCGDGFVYAGVEQCDDGNTIDTDACTSACNNAACGDGFIQAGVEICDDANTADNDGCDSSCAIETGYCGGDPGTDCGICSVCDSSGFCADDLTRNDDCGICERCAAGGVCVQQANGGDIKDDCDDGTFCNGDELCDGAGACNAPPGNPCPIPATCDETNDECGCTNDSECPPCEVCNLGLSVCENVPSGQDSKNDCDGADLCLSGDCNGAGACEGTAPGTDCDTCGACDGIGNCAYDDTQDADCTATCQECSVLGACADQPSGNDVNNDCGKATNPCFTGTCDGSGACRLESAGVDCDICGACDSVGVCIYDASQDAECGTCDECASLGSCGPQAAGTDVKNECEDGTFCNGIETCNGGSACGGPPGDPCSGSTACDESNNMCIGCLNDGDCGPCERCNTSGGAGAEFCEPQPAGTDTKNDCNAALSCLTGTCDGSGGCQFTAPGTGCATCGACDNGGVCVYNPLLNVNCGTCQECDSLGTCRNQTAGTDVKGDCAAIDACNLGCNGGICDFAGAGTDCGICANCDGSGGCAVYDDTQDADCPTCQECSGVATCTLQSAGSDVNNECPDSLYCNGVEACDGSGMCQVSSVPPIGSPCTGATPVCDEVNAGCVECLIHLDCPLCMGCSLGPNICQDLPPGNDVKNECDGTDPCLTGDCDGAGVCAITGIGVACDICGACDGSGICQYDDTLDADCNASICQQCSGLGTCANQAAGTDLNDDCSDGTFCNGDEVCGAGGVCDATSQGDPCAPQLCDELTQSCNCATDVDGDGFCAGVDCDDTIPTCTTECVTNSDGAGETGIYVTPDCVELFCGSDPVIPLSRCAQVTADFELDTAINDANASASSSYILIGDTALFDSAIAISGSGGVIFKQRAGTWITDTSAAQATLILFKVNVGGKDIVFDGLRIQSGGGDGAETTIQILGSDNSVLNCTIMGYDRYAVEIRGGKRNQIIGNTFFGGTDLGSLSAAIWIKDGNDTVIADNVVVTWNHTGILLDNADDTLIDHNTIENDVAAAITTNGGTSNAVCMRNNNLTTTNSFQDALSLQGDILFDILPACIGLLPGGPSYGNNWFGFNQSCTGSFCANLPPGSFWEFNQDPIFVSTDPLAPEGYCLGSSILIDAAHDLTVYDLNGTDPGLFTGTGPDVGARESGSDGCP